MTPCCLVVDTDVLEEVAVSLLISVVKVEAESAEKRLYLPTDLHFVTSQKSVWMLCEYLSQQVEFYLLCEPGCIIPCAGKLMKERPM
jgi:hypothetical protein